MKSSPFIQKYSPYDHKNSQYNQICSPYNHQSSSYDHKVHLTSEKERSRQSNFMNQQKKQS